MPDPGPTSASPRGAAADSLAAATELAARRLTEYVELCESAMSRMAQSEYHSEDLLDDWFAWWGKCVRDSTAMAALVWRAAEATPRADERAADDDGSP